ncbi:type VII secretion target [Streptomyces sp. NPDC006990]|uniref:type VII secretion target n=1 Tax=Streptomyces sp. NPDC006990 TaxID=3154481 RepID=UPI0034534CBB
MSFEQEWAGLKAAYAPESAVHTRLAGTGGTGGCGSGSGGGQQTGPRLHVTAHVLRGRAGRAGTVRGQFLKADDEVMRETGEITGSLGGFRTETALATFQERWRDQMSYVDEQFSGTASALRTAAGAFTTEDHRRKTDIDRIAAATDRRGRGDESGPDAGNGSGAHNGRHLPATSGSR